MWKAYPVGNKGESPEWNAEQKSTVLLSMWTNLRIAFLEITKKSNQLLCGRGIPCKDEGFEREYSLTPILLTIFIFYKLVYIEIMAWGC